MKVIRATSSQLDITSFSLKSTLFLFLFGVPFVGAGVWMASSAKLAVLECQRIGDPQPTCVIRESYLFKSATLDIGSLREASLKENSGDDSSTYAVMIHSSTGTYQLNTATSGYRGQQNRVRAINTFLENTTQTRSEVQQDERLTLGLFGLVFIMAGLLTWSILFNKTRLMFNKTTGTLTIQRTNLLTNKITDRPLQMVQSVDIEEVLDSDGDPNGYQIWLKILNEDPVKFKGNYYNSFEEASELAQRIRSFLGLRDQS